MATILTVHGTGASGPETGEQWWQKGSEFEGCMRRLVEPNEGDTGELNFQPVIWDGANSETSRRKAGTELCGKMNELEARSEPYSIIGHSHGGSVISAALVNHAGKRCTLDHLKNWITVGTPFIQSRKERFLFLRLGTIGKMFYGGLLGLILFITIPSNLYSMYISFTGQCIKFFDGCGRIDIAIAIGSWMLTIPFIVYYFAGRRMERGKTLRYQGAVTNFLSREYQPRFFSLWHKNDEAIQGLASMKSLRFDIFDKAFAIGSIKKLLLLFIPIVLLGTLVLSPPLMRSFYNTVGSFEITNMPTSKSKSDPTVRVIRPLYKDGEDVGENIGALMLTLTRTSASIGCRAVSNILSCKKGYRKSVGFGFAVLFLLGFFMLGWYIAGLIAGPGSAMLAWMLNATARSQIRATAFGSDAQVDEAVDARSWPMWMETGQPSLPDELANEIQAHADKAAALAIPKFRNAARLFASAGDDTNKSGANSNNASSSDMLSEYLTWDELIHTSYFTNQRFCKLVAYALTQNGGLRATPAFKADPDYALVARWHAQLIAGNEQPA